MGRRDRFQRESPIPTQAVARCRFVRDSERRMDFVRRLTGPPLKRLYKYLLRKSVGTYLLGELTVDQLDIQIIEGEVNLKGLQVRGSPRSASFLRYYEMPCMGAA